MQNTKCEIRVARHKHAFSIAELLLALAIAGVLLVAVAAAFNASVINYRENENAFKTINNARQALFRITSQLRTASTVDPGSPGNECRLVTADGDDITYRYNSVDNKLYLITNDDSSDADYLLCDNVIAAAFTKAVATEDEITYVKSVQVSITVASGDVQKRFWAAAVVRRNLK